MEYKLSVKEVLIEAFNSLLNNWYRLFSVLIIALAITASISIYLVATDDEGDWFLSIVSGLVNIFIAVVVHRSVIGGDDAIRGIGYFRFGKRELNYMIMTIVLIIVIALPMIPIYFVVSQLGFLVPIESDFSYSLASAKMFVLMLIGMYFFARISLVLPSIAVDDEKSVSWSWRATKGNGLRLMCVTVLVPGAIGMVIDWIASDVLWIEILSQFFNIVLMVFGVAILSVSYKVFAENT